MKRQFIFLSLIILSIYFLTPKNVLAADPRYSNPYQGVFQCHANNKAGVEYLKGGSEIIRWSTLQATSPDSLRQTAVSELIAKLKAIKQAGKRVYLHTQIYPEAGGVVFPYWLNLDDEDRTNDQIEVIYMSGVPRPAPWGPIYQEKLGRFLSLLNQALEANDVLDTIEYIEPSVGGIWGTTHLWTSESNLNDWANAAGCGSLTGSARYTCLGNKFTEGVNGVIRTYAKSLPKIPMMIIGGSCGNSTANVPLTECNYHGYNEMLTDLGMRFMFKEAGLGHPNSECGLHGNIINPLCGYPSGYGSGIVTLCGEEPWGDSILCGGPGFNPATACGKNYEQVYTASTMGERLSYQCLYSDDIGCSGTTTVNYMVANHIGAQITLAESSFDSLQKEIGNTVGINFKWRNSGSIPLTAPIKQPGSYGEKWLNGSYKLFLEFVNSSGQTVHYQEFDLNPPSNTWQPVKRTVDSYFEAAHSISFNVPASLGGSSPSSSNTYKVYAGIVEPGNRNSRFVLINSEAANDKPNRRYLLTSSFTVTGQAPSPTPTSIQQSLSGGWNNLTWNPSWSNIFKYSDLPESCAFVLANPGNSWTLAYKLDPLKNANFIANKEYYINCRRPTVWNPVMPPIPSPTMVISTPTPTVQSDYTNCPKVVAYEAGTMNQGLNDQWQQYASFIPTVSGGVGKIAVKAGNYGGAWRSIYCKVTNILGNQDVSAVAISGGFRSADIPQTNWRYLDYSYRSFRLEANTTYRLYCRGPDTWDSIYWVYENPGNPAGTKNFQIYLCAE